MKKLIPLYFLIVISICFVGNYLFEQSVVFNSEISGAAKLHRIKKTFEKEIPIIGSSRALGCYIPDRINDHCYNYGINDTAYPTHRYFLKKELAKDKATPIIINFDYHFFSQSIGDINNYIPHYSEKDIKNILKTKKKDKFMYNLPFLKYFGAFEYYVKDKMNEKLQLTKFTSKGASIEKNELTQKKFNRLVEKRRLSKTAFEPNAENVEDFLAMIEAHPNRMIKIVVAPYHNSVFESFENISNVNEFLTSLNKHKNIDIIDLSHLELGNDQYLNTTHVNYNGAVVFSDTLKSVLKPYN